MNRYLMVALITFLIMYPIIFCLMAKTIPGKELLTYGAVASLILTMLCVMVIEGLTLLFTFLKLI